jgi:hypothetical protein
MIKTWCNFNESSESKNDNIKDILFQKISETRELFYELEDLGIIKYTFIVSGYERGGSVYLDPKLSTKMGDIKEFIEYITPTVKYGLNHDVRFYNGKKIRSTPDENVCLLLEIKIPGESNEFGSTVIAKEGISLFDDIISGVNRLEDLGYNVKLDFNASHGEYKPLRILCYFNI